MSVKEQVLQAIQRLPDDIDYPAIADEIARLALLAGVKLRANKLTTASTPADKSVHLGSLA